MGTLSFRIAEIENSIPYADVKKEFGKDRERWVSGINEHHGSAAKLAELTLELLEAFTPSCKKFIFADDPGGFERLRKGCQHVIAAPAKKASAAGKELTDVRAQPALHAPRTIREPTTCAARAPAHPNGSAPPPAASPSPFPLPTTRAILQFSPLPGRRVAPRCPHLCLLPAAQ